MQNEVSIKIRIDDKNIKTVTVDADDLRKAIGTITAEVKSLNSELVNSAQTGQVFMQMGNAISQLYSSLQGLSDAYQLQSEGETRLAQAMRNTMGASDEEIESVKELCAAQQQMGIIGDEVQLAASQELATYLGMSSNLKALIPVMNDMIAQQLGYNATAESATQIASMLGKVMNGQTEALSRYGYKFDDAQKYILQYGDESERAAVLAQVVEEAVGGMNQAMAQTSVGQLKQVENTLGDMKESVGQFFQGLMPAITGLYQFAMASTGIGTLYASLKSLNIQMIKNRTSALLAAAAHRIQAAAQRLAASSAWTAVFGTRALTVAVTALYAAMSLGLSVAITAIVSLFSSMGNKAEEAADSVDEVNEAEDAYKNASSQLRGELAGEIVALKELIKSHGQAADKIAELNKKYGEAFGCHQTASEWYDTLINKSQAYCRQLGYEAKAKVQQKELGDLMIEKDSIDEQIKEVKAAGITQAYVETPSEGVAPVTEMGVGIAPGRMELKKTKLGELLDQQAKKNEEIAKKTEEVQKTIQKAKEAADEVGADNPATTTDWKKMNLTNLGTAIHEQEGKVKGLVGVKGKEAEAAKESKVLEQMQARQKALQKQYNLDSKSSGSSDDKYKGDALLNGAKTYKELGNNIKYYQKQLEETDMADSQSIQTISKKIAALQKQQEAIKDAQAEAERPATTDTLKDIDKELAYQETLRKKATKENIAGIEAEIQKLQTKKRAMEDAAYTPPQIGKINSYDELEKALQHYQNKIKYVSKDEQAEIQGQINKLQELKQAWDDALDEMDKPKDISELKTEDELATAIEYYGKLKKKQSGDELLATQQTIDALERKKATLEALESVAGMQNEVAGLNATSDKKDLKLKLELLGIDGIEKKIMSLQDLLNQTEMPLSDEQRKMVTGLIATYKKYEQILKKSNLTFAKGYGTVKGIGSGVKGLTEALQGNGTAWDKVCGIIDATMQMYDGFKEVVEIIRLLTGATKAQTVAKQEEGAQSMVTAGQEVAGAAMSVAASESETTAKNEETTANVAEAASGIFSAHSGIPWVGVIIAAAMVATMIALMAGLPKFAEGGVAYGPTLGMFGEYPGASNNPEVVAPLSKLKDLISSDAGGSGNVVFRIQGRELVGILQKENKYIART